MFLKLKSMTVIMLVMLCVFSVQAYAGARVVGSWKVTVAGAPANSPAIFLVSIQRGGIVMIAQANAFRSTAIGHWNRIGRKTYRFQDTHLIYDDVSPYAVTATEEHFVTLTLANNGETFSGDAQLVSTDLNGNIISDFNLDIVGNRLPDPDF